MRKHTKALATIMAAAALAMVTNSRIPITNIWYYVGQDGKWYCFDRNNGDMKRGTTIDGYTVDFILAGFREKELCADQPAHSSFNIHNKPSRQKTAAPQHVSTSQHGGLRI